MAKKTSFFIRDFAYGDEKSKRAHEKRKLEAFESLPRIAEKMRGWWVDDKKSLEEKYSIIINWHQKALEAGRIEREHAYHNIFYLVETIAGEKIKNSEKIKKLNSKLDKLERSHGLKEDEYFSPKDAPPDIQALQIEWDLAYVEVIADTLKEFGEIELAHLLLNDKEEFDRIMNVGNEQRIEYEKYRH